MIEMQIKDRVGKLIEFGNRQDQHYALRAKEIDDAEFRRPLAGGGAKALDRPRFGREAARRGRSCRDRGGDAERAQPDLLCDPGDDRDGSGSVHRLVLFVWLYVGRNILRRIGKPAERDAAPRPG